MSLSIEQDDGEEEQRSPQAWRNRSDPVGSRRCRARSGRRPQGAEERQPEAESPAAAKNPPRAAKAKSEASSNENIGIGDIKKAAAFMNSVGGSDKAVSLLQILKVAKEVQQRRHRSYQATLTREEKNPFASVRLDAISLPILN